MEKQQVADVVVVQNPEQVVNFLKRQMLCNQEQDIMPPRALEHER